MTIDADAEYLAAIEEVRKQNEVENPTFRDHRRHDAATGRAAQAFGRERGWTFAYGYGCDKEKPFRLYELLRGLKRRTRAGSMLVPLPLFDHEFGFRDTKGFPVAIVSHPYDGRHKRDDANAFAATFGLKIEFPDLVSWWNPGHTSIFVWTRNPDPTITDLGFTALRSITSVASARGVTWI